MNMQDRSRFQVISFIILEVSGGIRNHSIIDLVILAAFWRCSSPDTAHAALS